MSEWKYSKIGIVPKEWDKKVFNEIFYERSAYADQSQELPLYSLTIEDGVVPKTDRYERSHLVKKGKENYKVVKPGDFVYNPMNLRFGALARYKGEFPVLVSGYYNIFYAKDYNLAKFMEDFLISERLMYLYNALATGSLIEKKRFHFSEFLKLELPLPNENEMTKIADILSTWDEAIVLKKQRLTKKIQKKQELTRQLITGKKRLPGFEEIWEKVKIRDIATAVFAGATPSTRDLSFWNGDIPWMSSGEVNNRYVFKTDKTISAQGFNSSSTKWVPKNSILVALAGQGQTRGRVAINKIDLTTNQSIAAIVPEVKNVHYKYLFYNLESRYNELRLLSTGDGGRGGLNLQIINGVDVKLPKVQEQKAIANVLSTADEEIQLLEKELTLLKEQKKGLMQVLLTGKIRVLL